MTTNDFEYGWEEAMTPEEHATAVTRAGVLVCLLVLLAYLLELGVSFLTGRETSGVAILGDLISLGLSALLLWRVWTRQALWAALLAGVFFTAECAAQLGSFLKGAPTGGLVIMFATLAGGCAVSSFGAWRVAGLRQDDL